MAEAPAGNTDRNKEGPNILNPYIQRFGCPSGALFGYKFGKAK